MGGVFILSFGLGFEPIWRQLAGGYLRFCSMGAKSQSNPSSAAPTTGGRGRLRICSSMSFVRKLIISLLSGKSSAPSLWEKWTQAGVAGVLRFRRG